MQVEIIAPPFAVNVKNREERALLFIKLFEIVGGKSLEAAHVSNRIHEEISNSYFGVYRSDNAKRENRIFIGVRTARAPDMKIVSVHDLFPHKESLIAAIYTGYELPQDTKKELPFSN